jgi:hypothetical protein
MSSLNGSQVSNKSNEMIQKKRQRKHPQGNLKALADR